MATSFEEFQYVMGLFPRMAGVSLSETQHLYSSFLTAEREELAEPMDFFKYYFDQNLGKPWRQSFLTRRQYADLCRQVNDSGQSAVVADKATFSAHFGPFLGRNVVVAHEDERAAFNELISSQEQVFIKPANGGYGLGTGFASTADPDALWEKCVANRCVVEEPIAQHEICAAPHPQSVNCVRVVSALQTGNAPVVIAAALRTGEGGSVTDSGGGMAAPLDVSTGRVSGPAVTHFCEIYKTHPDTGARFEEIALPNWEGLLKSVERVAQHASGLRLMNWDWACRQDGTWILIEGNVAGGIGACQQASGRGYAHEIYAALGIGA